MLSPHKGGEALEAVAPAFIADGNDHSAAESPCSIETPLGEPLLTDEGETEPHQQSGEFLLRPLSDALLDHDGDLVLGDDTVEIPTVELRGLSTLLRRDEPLTWVFAGVRPMGDATFGDGRLAGEWFAEEWRAESGRTMDLVIDGTWPDCQLATLKSHLRSRVVRHRPEIAVLFFDHRDAAAGIEELSQFERRLLAVLSVLSEIGTIAVLAQSALDDSEGDIDREVYAEALAGIAKERNVAHLTLPAMAAQISRTKTPNSAARNAGLFLCREAIRAL